MIIDINCDTVEILCYDDTVCMLRMLVSACCIQITISKAASYVQYSDLDHDCAPAVTSKHGRAIFTLLSSEMCSYSGCF